MPESAATNPPFQAVQSEKALRVAVTAFAAALGLYAATCSRGVNWQDSGVHQQRIVSGALENPLGLALSHPLHYWIGRAVLAVPFGEPALRLNALSALFGAAGIGALAWVIAAWTQSGSAALLGAAAAGLAHAYWQMSCLTETYTLAACLMTLEWVCLVRYQAGRGPVWLVALFATNGLHVADHLLGTLTLATYAVWLLVELRRRRATPATAGLAWVAWIAAASPYWALVWAAWARDGGVWATLSSALFGREYAGDVLNTRLSWSLLATSAMTLAYNFPSLVTVVAAAGVVAALRGEPQRGRRAATGGAARPGAATVASATLGSGGGARAFATVVAAQTLVVGAFVGRYSIRDQYTFFVPVCVLVGLWFGLGSAVLMRAAAQRGWAAALLWINVALAPLAYAVFPGVARERGWLASRLRDLPYRDEYSYFFHPWKAQDRSAAEYSDAILARLRPGDVVLADLTTGYTLAYSCTARGRPDGVTVYALTYCASDPRAAALHPREVADRVRSGAGGRVVAVASRTVESLWPDLVFDKSDELLWVARAGGTARGPASGPGRPP